MDELPRLRPRQWELLRRFITIEQRMEEQHAEGDRTITVLFANAGPRIVRPGVASPKIDRGDMHALRDVGAFDVHSWNDLAVFRISQVGYDLAGRQQRAAGEPTSDDLLAQYRAGRRLLASRISQVARWTVLVLGIAVVLWSALSGSWIYAVIGVIGAVFGTPVTRLASWVHRRVTDAIDRRFLVFFEGRSPHATATASDGLPSAQDR